MKNGPPLKYVQHTVLCTGIETKRPLGARQTCIIINFNTNHSIIFYSGLI